MQRFSIGTRSRAGGGPAPELLKQFLVPAHHAVAAAYASLVEGNPARRFLVRSRKECRASWIVTSWIVRSAIRRPYRSSAATCLSRIARGRAVAPTAAGACSGG